MQRCDSLRSCFLKVSWGMYGVSSGSNVVRVSQFGWRVVVCSTVVITVDYRRVPTMLGKHRQASATALWVEQASSKRLYVECVCSLSKVYPWTVRGCSSCKRRGASRSFISAVLYVLELTPKGCVGKAISGTQVRVARESSKELRHSRLPPCRALC
jgi:hypothetical protein